MSHRTADLADAAQQYRARGWSVVPTFGKAAYFWGEYEHRLAEPDELEMAFTPNGHGSPTGLAIVIGEATWATHPGLYVLEFEARHRGAAEPWLNEHLPVWRDGLVAESGGGSLHVYCSAGKPVALRKHAWGEVRGGGSITVLPPSTHPNGRPYRWVSIGEPIRADPSALPLPGLATSERLYESLGEGPISEGSRNDTLLSLGGLLRHAGLDSGTIDTTLRHVNAERCEPPLEESEVASIARSVSAYPAGGALSPRARTHATSNLKTPPLEVGLRKRSAAEMIASAPADLTLPSLPLLGQDGYIVQGWGHIVAGYPKCGKTELLARCVQGWCQSGTTVHWLTEESESVWTQRLARWSETPDGLFLTFALGTDPRALVIHAANGDEDVIIVDTLRNLLGLDDENDNAHIAKALIPWEAALQGRSRIYVHHDRKGGGEHGQAIAGGAAFLGVVDRALELKYDPQARRRRRIEVHSRITEAPDLLYELTDSGDLVALGDPAQVSLDAVKDRLTNILTDEWKKTSDLQGALGEPQPSLEQIRQALTAMTQDDAAQRDPPIGESAQGRTVRWRSA
jgi:hypothetical protein